MWRLGSVYFNKVCTAWNIAVLKVCNLPYTTHRWFLGPLMNQPHISYQLQKRCIRFLHNMKTSQNEIVLTSLTKNEITFGPRSILFCTKSLLNAEK